MSKSKQDCPGVSLHGDLEASMPASSSEWSVTAMAEASREAATQLSRQQEMLQSALGISNFPFVGNSPAMQKVFDLIRRVADTDSTVLILGESGTGKELVAKALHFNSTRSAKAFVPVNCGAIPSELLESELFGHVKGAYTGAHTARVGRFTLAHQGSLFLDEIGTMPAALQVKILRALQEKEFEPVGSAKTQKSDCRVIAATNNDLEQEVLEGRFREDLFYRLNVIPIHLPPLRDRRDDIPLLISHFISRLNEKQGFKILGVSKEAMNIMTGYPWPGNVREIENICQRLCILKAEGVIEPGDLPTRLMQGGSGLQRTKLGLSMGVELPEEGLCFDSVVQEFENRLIMTALERTRWNKNKAAQLLQMNRTTLVEKIKKRGLQST
ncbi:MAG: sigma-54-dependent Fis family transcriptional regulator [Bradymonadales bacterium]|nr:MAG: sigma-54-dependent Fis family transcriptional regulator [Bradymonadales bacterium]